MKLLLTIAWRNILRHKGKSLVIGAILFLGALLMTAGNGVISGMSAGVEKNIVNGFMGDIVLMSDKQKSDNILFEFMAATIEPIHSYPQIAEILSRQSYVERYLPVGKNGALVLSENEATPGFAYLIGADLAEYQKMFPGSLNVVEGGMIEPGEKALLVPTFAREKLYDYLNYWLIPQGGSLIKENLSKDALENIDSLAVSTTVVMMGMSSGINSTSDVRFTVKGIVKFNALNQIFGHFCIADIESYRECLGYFTSSQKTAEVPREEQKLLDMETEDLDSLFGTDAMVVPNTRKPSGAVPGGDRPVPPLSTNRGQSLAARQTGAVPGSDSPVPQTGAVPGGTGTYNAVFIKLKPGVSYREAVGRLNRALSESNSGVRAVTWNKASGPIGSMAIIIKSALFLFVTLLFCVAVIIIVNTLTMAALERTSELGMMRAIGARKSFIGGMFLGETAILSALFGGVGVLVGILAVKLVPLFRITSANDMVQILYGGDTFHPLLGVSDITLTVVQLAVVTVIAALYPMKVARGITPLDAITRD